MGDCENNLSYKLELNDNTRDQIILSKKIIHELPRIIISKSHLNNETIQYLKDNYAEKVRKSHLQSTTGGISNDNFILMDGTDISK